MISTRGIQEGLIALIWYSEEHAKVACSVLPVGKYDKLFGRMAAAGIRFYEDYGRCVGDHDLDLIDELCEEMPDSSAAIKQVQRSMLDSVDGLSPSYLFDKASIVVQEMELRSSISEAARLLADGGNNHVMMAQAALSRALTKKEDLSFDPGASLFNPADSARVFASLDDDKAPFKCGIPEIDYYGFGPARQTLSLFVAPPKAGKSWWLGHLAKRGHMQGLKVLFISLEMVEYQVSQRLMMSLFSIAKRRQEISYQVFDDPEEMKRRGLDRSVRTLKNQPSWDDEGIRTRVKGLLKGRAGGEEIRVKSFPTNTLSIEALEAYLDMLEAQCKFVPDLLLIDYADIMKLPGGESHRLKTGEVYKELRRVAIERYVAVATATQAGRGSRLATRLDDSNVSEDYSKIFTADTVFTYSQTPWEQRMKLARIYLAAGRGDQDKFEVLISQHYGIGQFCLDSTMVGDAYTKEIKSRLG